MPVPRSIRSSVPIGSGRSAEMLLEVAAALHAGGRTAGSVAKAIPTTPSRVKRALEALEQEGVVVQAGGIGRARRWALTDEGAEALRVRGRVPGDVVVLFTDLVASTQMIGEHGELGAHERRLRHFELLRSVIVRDGGHEVKGLGDGLMVAFGSADAAISCAADMQRAVAEDADGLGLRVGIHVGPVLREGEDLHGTTVIVAARLCDRAESGETLVSAAVLDAAEGRRPARRELRGALELKGLDVPVETWAVGRAALGPAGGPPPADDAGRPGRELPRAARL